MIKLRAFSLAFLILLTTCASYGTVSSTTNSIDYDPNGSVTVFPYDYRVDEASDMKVYEDGVVVAGGYSVTGVGVETGGDVIFDVAPSGSVTVLTLIREVPLTQETAYPAYGPFPAAAHEAALDKLTFMSQQLEERILTVERSAVDPSDTDPVRDKTLSNYDLYSRDLLISSNTSGVSTNEGNITAIDLDVSDNAADIVLLNDDKMSKAQNLNDVSNKTTARSNLDVYSTGEVYTQTAADTLLDAKMDKAQNLDDVADKPTARTNLDVYSTGSIDSALNGKMDVLPGAWKVPTLLNGWTFDAQTPLRYRLINSSTTLQIMGTLNGAAATNVNCFVLDAGYRPISISDLPYFPGAYADGDDAYQASISVATSGNVNIKVNGGTPTGVVTVNYTVQLVLPW